MWEQNETGSERVSCEDVGPAIFGWLWRLGDDPKLAAWVVDDGDGVTEGRPDGPAASEEIDLVIRIAAPVEVDGQVKVQEAGVRTWAQNIALLERSFGPGIIGREACGAADGEIQPFQFVIQKRLC